MVEPVYLISALAIIITAPAIYLWIKTAQQIGLVGRDMHSLKEKFIAESGGLPTMLSFVIALLLTTVISKYFNLPVPETMVYAFITLITFALFIGFLDDVLGWKQGISQRKKVLLSFLIPLPAVLFQIGITSMNLPFLGQVNLGALYFFIVVPLGIIGFSNAFNMFAGMRGLEGYMAAVFLLCMSKALHMQGQMDLFFITVGMLASVCIFLIYNLAHKIFPGDSFTYTLGAFIATVAIFGNMEKFAVFMAIPYFVEFAIKAKTKFKGESFAKINQDGTLWVNRVESLTHVPIKYLKMEKEVMVVTFWVVFEVVLGLIALNYLVI